MTFVEQHVISVSDLQFSWPGHTPLLQIASLQVEQGERLFIKGGSGSGKSTLLGLLAGIHCVNQGMLSVLGKELKELSASQRDHFRANHMGYIFQQFNLLPFLSVVENVTSPLIFSPSKRQRLLDTPHQEAHRLLDALQLPDSLRQRPVHQLSIGQQQRVAAARALIGSPELVIADEPTSALDTGSRLAFMQLLFSECERLGSSLLFVSHDPSLESLFPRVIALSELNQANVELPPC
jgi:putative ABC transport system ATP-binding protein